MPWPRSADPEPVQIGIHWPNDVMLDGRKLAGILIEVLADGKHVIGIGINTNNTAADAPEEVRPRVATLRDVTGQTHDSTELLIAILQQLQRQLAELALSPERVAARTHELCLQRGKRVADHSRREADRRSLSGHRRRRGPAAGDRWAAAGILLRHRETVGWAE